MATRPDGAIPRRAMATYHDFLRSLLSDRDRFFEEVVEGVGLRSKLRYAVVTIVALSGVAGLFGMYALHEGLSLVCEKREVYPRKALTIMRAWAVLFAFVGIQLAWSLRPFLGDRNQPFRVFGTYQGNFYAAVIYAVNKLIQGEARPTAPSVNPDTLPRFRGLVLPLVDTLADTTRRRKRP